MASTVLVIDDEPDIRNIMRVTLEDAGYRVLEEGEGASAFKSLMQHVDPLIVILDLMLPKMDGIEVLNALASESLYDRRHAIIATTANYRVSKSMETVLRRYEIPILLKPFDISDFLAIVRTAESKLMANSPQTSKQCDAVPASNLLKKQQ